MAPSLRDRFFTPRVARAIMSPTGILAAGAGMAVGVLAGLPLLAAAGVGAAAYAGRVALAIPRRRRPTRPDPLAVDEPWRRYVKGALDAQDRFARSVDPLPTGPLRDELTAIGERIEHGIDTVWRIASRGDDIDHGLATLDTRQAEKELRALDGLPDAPHVAETRDAIQAQLATAERMRRISIDAQNRLRLLDARLDELVARAVELSVRGSATEVSGLDDEVEVLVQEMEALRLAVDEAEQLG